MPAAARSARSLSAVRLGTRNTGRPDPRLARYGRKRSTRSVRIGCTSSRRRLLYPAVTLTVGGSASRSKHSGVRLLSSFARNPVPRATRYSIARSAGATPSTIRGSAVRLPSSSIAPRSVASRSRASSSSLSARRTPAPTLAASTPASGARSPSAWRTRCMIKASRAASPSSMCSDPKTRGKMPG